MREIKFRIWDGKKNEWLGDSDKDTLTYYGFHLIGEVMSVQSPSCWALDEESVVEEYTGIKDMNGRDIYEGDIVVANDDVGIVNGDKNQVVKFDGGMFIVEQSFVSLSYLCNFNVMVLGNIHENPELLEETK